MNAFFQLWGCVIAVSAAAIAASARADVSPYFFFDDFEDTNIEDNTPVSWKPGNGFGESIDASSGDLVVTPNRGGLAWVGYYQDDMAVGYIYDDVSIRSQVAVPSGEQWYYAGIAARATPGFVYSAGITSSTHPMGRVLSIAGFFPGFQQLFQTSTDLDPAETDVSLQFDLVGDTLTLTAWEAGTSQEFGEQIQVRDNKLQQGAIGVEYWDHHANQLPAPTPGTYRYYQAVAEPAAFADFNQDGVVDGADFLKWQRGETPFPFSAMELSDWETHFGATLASSGAAAEHAGVPEPASVALLMVGLAASWMARRRGRSYRRNATQRSSTRGIGTEARNPAP